MALGKCPECSNDVSSTAIACPKCGYNLFKERAKKQTSKNVKGCGIGCLSLFGIIIIISIITSINTDPTDRVNSKLKARIDSVSVAPFINSAGEQHQILLFHWTNTGSDSIGTVWADIGAYDKKDNLICSYKNECIFTATSNAKIPPSSSFVASEGNGSEIIIPGQINGNTDITIWQTKPKAVRGVATITKLEKKGFID